MIDVLILRPKRNANAHLFGAPVDGRGDHAVDAEGAQAPELLLSARLSL